MRKIFLASSMLLLLASCSLTGSSDSFLELYENHVTAQFERIDSFTKYIGLERQEEIAGTAHAAFAVPILLSGALDLEYQGKTFGKNVDFALENVRFAYESMMGTGGIQAKKIGVISHNGDAYFLFSELMSSELLSPQIQTVLKKYDSTWLSWTREDAMKSLSGATEEEALATTITNNLSKMTLADVSTSLKKHMIWKTVGSSTSSGNLQVFPIDLDRENVIALVDSMSRDITGSGMTDIQKLDLNTLLQNTVFQGTLAFDPDDVHVSHMILNIMQSGSLKKLAQVEVHETKNALTVDLISIPDNMTVHFAWNLGDTESTLNLALTQSGVEMANVLGKVDYTGRIFRSLSLDVMAQGVAVNLSHTQKEDGNFEGKLQLPVGAMSWNGQIKNKKMTALSLKGALPTGAIDMNLTESGSKLRGPLIVRNGGEEMFRANIGLILEDEKVGLDVNVPDKEGTGSSLSFESLVTYTKKSFNSEIAAPKNTQPLQSLIDQLDALVPADMPTYSLDDSTGSDTPDISPIK